MEWTDVMLPTTNLPKQKQQIILQEKDPHVVTNLKQAQITLRKSIPVVLRPDISSSTPCPQTRMFIALAAAIRHGSSPDLKPALQAAGFPRQGGGRAWEEEQPTSAAAALQRSTGALKARYAALMASIQRIHEHELAKRAAHAKVEATEAAWQSMVSSYALRLGAGVVTQQKQQKQHDSSSSLLQNPDAAQKAFLHVLSMTGGSLEAARISNQLHRDIVCARAAATLAAAAANDEEAHMWRYAPRLPVNTSFSSIAVQTELAAESAAIMHWMHVHGVRVA